MEADDKPETFEGFITKYVGTVEKRLFQKHDVGTYAFTIDRGDRLWGKVGRDVWLTEAEAEADARRRVQRKVKSLEKQIAALRSGPYGSTEPRDG